MAFSNCITVLNSVLSICKDHTGIFSLYLYITWAEVHDHDVSGVWDMLGQVRILILGVGGSKFATARVYRYLSTRGVAIALRNNENLSKIYLLGY